MAIRRGLIALAVLATLGGADLAVAAGPPGGLQVDVVNTPLPVTGSVTGTVGLAPGTSVLIDNTVGDPVRVRNVNDAIQPVQASSDCTQVQALGCQPTIYTVPASKRLVIEYASMSLCALPGISAQLSITTTVGGVTTTHFVNILPPAAGPGTANIGCNSGTPSSFTAVGQQVRLYADAGTPVLMDGDRTNTAGKANFSFSISGYLVDVPLTP
jgi:hypothetical protein